MNDELTTRSSFIIHRSSLSSCTMSDTPRPDPAVLKSEEERLIQALVGRGLLVREEAQQCGSDPPLGASKLLGKLVEAGFLTAGQAQRARQELSSLLNQQIPNYQLLEKLGQGAMGVVYKARQLSMNRLVAVKVLSPRLVSQPEYLQRLRREAHTAARLRQHKVVHGIDGG